MNTRTTDCPSITRTGAEWVGHMIMLPLLLASILLCGPAGCDGDNPVDPDPVPVPRVVFEDDFEGNGCLAKWTVGGRRQEGENTADCVERDSSICGHLYKSSFTEITLSPTGGPWPYSESLLFTYDFRVRVYSSGGAPSNYYGRAGVEYQFMENDIVIGRVGYIAATTSYPFDQVAGDTAAAFIAIPTDTDLSYSLTVDEILSHVPKIDRSRITGVVMILRVYSSTRPLPYVNGELWIDNIVVTAGSEGV